MVPSMSESNRRVIIDAKGKKKKVKKGLFFFPPENFWEKGREREATHGCR